MLYANIYLGLINFGPLCTYNVHSNELYNVVAWQQWRRKKFLPAGAQPGHYNNGAFLTVAQAPR